MKGIIRSLYRRLAALPRARYRRCCLCDHRVGRFLPYRAGGMGRPPLMRALEVVGSDRENFECPRCGGHYRERHLLLYLRASGLLDRMPGMRVLHFAPEARLSRFLSNAGPGMYVACDLHPPAGHILRVDIEAMPFESESFDLVIANHVLEHVADDLKAVSEIHRVLASGGTAILQTPYSRILHETWSDDGIVGDSARMHAYGQGDHVRLFGRDIFERIESSGLRACVATHAELLPDVDAFVSGVNTDEPFFLFRRD